MKNALIGKLEARICAKVSGVLSAHVLKVWMAAKGLQLPEYALFLPYSVHVDFFSFSKVKNQLSDLTFMNSSLKSAKVGVMKIAGGGGSPPPSGGDMSAEKSVFKSAIAT